MGHYTGEYRLRPDVSAEETDNQIQYKFPCERDVIHTCYSWLASAVRCLMPVAVNTDDKSYDSAFTYFGRRIRWIYSTPYEYKFDEKKIYKLPAVGEVGRFNWYDGIDKQTVTLKNTEDSFIVEYSNEFLADEELTIYKDEINPVKKTAIKGLSDGIHSIHSPLNGKLEEWRHKSKSEFSFSLKSERVSDSSKKRLVVGIKKRGTPEANLVSY